MSELQKEVDCDLCGSPEKIYIKSEDGYPISRCKKCSLIYVNRIPQIEEGKVIGEYYEGSEREIEESQRRYQRVSEFLTDELNKLHPKKGALLDVGCGYGFFLLEARKKGWRVFGTELSHIAVNYAREKQNLPDVFFSDLSDIEFAVEKFDAINLTNVLEHVPSPTRILENCRDRMATDAVLLIRVPNMVFYKLKERFNALLKFSRLVTGGELNYLATPPPYHLIGYTPQTIEKFLTKVGLEVIEIKPSRLSAMAEENIIFRIFEKFIEIIYKLSFARLNLSPTMLVTAAKRKQK